jgi:hypothetical protein
MVICPWIFVNVYQGVGKIVWPGEAVCNYLPQSHESGAADCGTYGTHTHFSCFCLDYYILLYIYRMMYYTILYYTILLLILYYTITITTTISITNSITITITITSTITINITILYTIQNTEYIYITVHQKHLVQNAPYNTLLVGNSCLKRLALVFRPNPFYTRRMSDKKFRVLNCSAWILVLLVFLADTTSIESPHSEALMI